MRGTLAHLFDMPETDVSAALAHLVGAMLPRLSPANQASLASWIPEGWTALVEGSARGARGADEFKTRLADAGVPGELTARFAAEFVRLVGERCGAPLATAIRRRIPEIEQLERECLGG